MTAVAIVIGLALGLSGFLIAVLALESASKSRPAQKSDHAPGSQTYVSVFVGPDDSPTSVLKNRASGSSTSVHLEPTLVCGVPQESNHYGHNASLGIRPSPEQSHLLESGQQLRRVF